MIQQTPFAAIRAVCTPFRERDVFFLEANTCLVGFVLTLYRLFSQLIKSHLLLKTLRKASPQNKLPISCWLYFRSDLFMFHSPLYLHCSTKEANMTQEMINNKDKACLVVALVDFFDQLFWNSTRILLCPFLRLFTYFQQIIACFTSP